jgi:hypothetical protein
MAKQLLAFTIWIALAPEAYFTEPAAIAIAKIESKSKGKGKAPHPLLPQRMLCFTSEQ